MCILYNYLQVDRYATLETISKKYRALSYSYYNGGCKENLQNINLAFQILRDPYKRAFYDRFGDAYIGSLSNPTESIFISRFFVPLNITLLYISLSLIIFNYFFLGLFIYFFPNCYNLLKFLPFICAPLVLIPVSISFSKLFTAQSQKIVNLPYVSCLLFSISVSIVILCTKFRIIYFFANEAVQLILVFIITYKSVYSPSKTVLGCLIKTLIFGVYYTNYNTIKYFLPCLTFSGSFFAHPILPIALAILMLPTCLSIYITDQTEYLKIGLMLNIIHASIGLIVIGISSGLIVYLYRGLPSNAKNVTMISDGNEEV